MTLGEGAIGSGERTDFNDKEMFTMSYKNFEKALELVKQCEDYTPGKGRTDEIIAQGEKLFGCKFSKQAKEYFKRYGWIGFGSQDFYGISTDDFSDKTCGGAIESALRDRKEFGLPKEWLCIHDFGYDGWRAFLDYGNLNKEGEPPVIVSRGMGKEFQGANKFAEGKAEYIDRNYLTDGIFAEDFGDFLLCLVEEELERQKQEQ